FQLVFNNPVIPLAEIAWRWTFAASAWLLTVLFLIEYADSLPVNALDRILLGTQQPVLVLRAIQRIFHGSEGRFITCGVFLVAMLAMAWVLAASLGRCAIIRVLLEELHAGQAPFVSFRSLLTLNF